MSVNCVDAALELSNHYNSPLMLIASRRQIDSAQFGGGYVNKWTTDAFADYVINNDKKGKVLLARDHGGPWQNPLEKTENMSLRRAMESAKDSFRADIEAGFQLLHLDPSVDIHDTPTPDDVLDRLFELYEFCWAEAQRQGRDIAFEIGTEEQSGGMNSIEDITYVLDSVLNFCKKNHFPLPTFVVLQAGTKVMETRNVGSFDSPFRVKGELPAEIQLPKLLELCNKYGLLMKEHNGDYLSNETLEWHPRLGIHACNVAPEFGVIETRELVALLENNGLSSLAEDFINLAYSSRKWEKWVVDRQRLSERECAIIAGHYVFSTDECREIKDKACRDLQSLGIDLNHLLKESVRQGILRYMSRFRLV
jgi:hypothetical protein